MTLLIVDRREPVEVEEQLLRARFAVLRAELACGDIYRPPDLLIERKTAGDVLKSIADGRLFAQTERMVSIARFAVVVVVGSLLPDKEGHVVADGRRTRWSWWSLRMALLTVQGLGALVVEVQRSQFTAFLRRLVAWVDKGERVAVRKPLFNIERDSRVDVLCSFPGIGPKTAKGLLEYCGNLGWALAALSSGGGPGVGLATVARARELLGLAKGEILSIVMEEENEDNQGID